MRNCHSERSEESLEFKQILYFVQDDKLAFCSEIGVLAIEIL